MFGARKCPYFSQNEFCYYNTGLGPPVGEPRRKGGSVEQCDELEDFAAVQLVRLVVERGNIEGILAVGPSSFKPGIPGS